MTTFRTLARRSLGDSSTEKAARGAIIEVIRLVVGVGADIQASYERLADVREGAGDRFLRELDRCASLVARYPSIGRHHRGPFRKLLGPVTRMAFFTPFSPRGW